MEKIYIYQQENWPNFVLCTRSGTEPTSCSAPLTPFENKPLTKERLFDWHYVLFPMGRSRMYKIITGNWRDDSAGPMQVISGGMGKEKVHYQAPPAKNIDAGMAVFLDWFNKNSNTDLVLKASVAHLWFVTLHPFGDVNGRIARAVHTPVQSGHPFRK